MSQPHSSENQSPKRSHGGFWHSTMGIVCLVLMGGVAALLMWRSHVSLTSGWWLLVPLALCVGMHLLMHRGHGHHKKD
ncbi:DUF2933 domain-containing protein [Litchfieldella rifensis]|uniref:DUF2933 domain-containing protein n=1 Tax=Litchfieldella rifensis TaxID=762643 RepID=A0ABV7LS65_9GAMM